MQLYLDMIGAHWIRQKSGMDPSDPIMRWAVELDEATKAIKLTVTEEFHSQVGMACLLALELDHKRCVGPKWQVVHVESDGKKAEQLRDALNEHIYRAIPIRFRVESQHALGTSRSVALERDLERVRIRILKGDQLRTTPQLLPLTEVERVAAEAIRFSQRLDRLDRDTLPADIVLSPDVNRGADPAEVIHPPGPEAATEDFRRPAPAVSGQPPDGLAPRSPPKPVAAWRLVKPEGDPLRGWPAILAALKADKNDRPKQRALKKESLDTDGPIHTVRGWPEAHKEQLIAWRQGIEDRAAEQEERRKFETDTKNELSERGGARLQDLKFHAERRPNARGKARPAKGDASK